MTVCLLDYEYIKNHYRLIAMSLSRQEKIWQIETIGKLKKLDNNSNATDACYNQSNNLIIL